MIHLINIVKKVCFLKKKKKREIILDCFSHFQLFKEKREELSVIWSRSLLLCFNI